MQFNVISIPIILGVGFLAFLMRLVAHRNRGRLVTIFMIFSSLVIASSLCYVVSLLSINRTVQFFFFHVMVFFTMFTPLAIMFFLLEYLGYDNWINLRSVSLLSVIPVVAGMLELTDPLHGLFWDGLNIIWVDGFSYVKEVPGFIPIILAIYLYFILGISIAIFSWGLLHSPSYRRQELNVVLVALSIPLLFDLVRTFELHPWPHIYITPFGIMISLLLLGVSIIKYDFLNMIPAAYDRLFTDVRDAILVFDHKLNIIDYNRAAGLLFFEDHRHRQRMSIEQLPPSIQEAIGSREGDVAIPSNGESRFFDLKVSELEGQDGFLRSMVVTLHDINWRKEAESQLQELIQSKESLLAEKELLLKEINHRVKNNFNLAGSLLYLEAQKFTDPSVKEAFDVSRDRLRTMSLLNERLYRSAAFNSLDLGSYLHSLAEDLVAVQSPEKREIQLTGHVEEVSVNPREAIPCGLIVNELVTNSLKHAFKEDSGPDPHVELGVSQTSEGLIRLSLVDNGCGYPANYNYASSESLGMRLVHMLGEDQLGGQIKIENDGGARFSLSFYPEESET